MNVADVTSTIMIETSIWFSKDRESIQRLQEVWANHWLAYIYFSLSTSAFFSVGVAFTPTSLCTLIDVDWHSMSLASVLPARLTESIRGRIRVHTVARFSTEHIWHRFLRRNHVICCDLNRYVFRTTVQYEDPRSTDVESTSTSKGPRKAVSLRAFGFDVVRLPMAGSNYATQVGQQSALRRLWSPLPY